MTLAGFDDKSAPDRRMRPAETARRLLKVHGDNALEIAVLWAAVAAEAGDALRARAWRSVVAKVAFACGRLPQGAAPDGCSRACAGWRPARRLPPAFADRGDDAIEG